MQPYFIYPLVKELQELRQRKESGPLAEEDALREQELCERIAANVGEPKALMQLIGEFDFLNFYPDDGAGRLSTEATIDSFLAKYNHNAIPEPIPAEPIPTEPVPVEPIPAEPIPAEPVLAEPIPTETIPAESPLPQGGEAGGGNASVADLKQLVKNREYGKALEIMESIYLNNPKKSVYFADQIRFIKKMMLNESKK